MIICIPVTEDSGLASPVSAHFGSAPFFMLVDDHGGVLRTVANRNQVHAHGGCQPLAAIEGERVDAIVVGGIGAGALAKIQAAGVAVIWSDRRTVDETVQALRASQLQRITPSQTCGHHHGGADQGQGAGGCHH